MAGPRGVPPPGAALPFPLGESPESGGVVASSPRRGAAPVAAGAPRPAAQAQRGPRCCPAGGSPRSPARGRGGPASGPGNEVGAGRSAGSPGLSGSPAPAGRPCPSAWAHRLHKRRGGGGERWGTLLGHFEPAPAARAPAEVAAAPGSTRRPPSLCGDGQGAPGSGAAERRASPAGRPRKGRGLRSGGQTAPCRAAGAGRPGRGEAARSRGGQADAPGGRGLTEARRAQPGAPGLRRSVAPQPQARTSCWGEREWESSAGRAPPPGGLRQGVPPEPAGPRAPSKGRRSAGTALRGHGGGSRIGAAREAHPQGERRPCDGEGSPACAESVHFTCRVSDCKVSLCWWVQLLVNACVKIQLICGVDFNNLSILNYLQYFSRCLQ